jgi:UDP-N-acetylmuramoyl-tripeptide--D-alanyl-D-alanine ligase
MSCEYSIQDLAKAVNGKVISIVEKRCVGVGTDTRENLDKKIFFALKGDNFDAHSFLSQAVSAGAKCLVIHKNIPELEKLKSQISVVLVRDTLTALQALATHWRKSLKAKIVGVTGSNGKTSTKEFLAAILSRQFKVHFSKGSFNNHWGVPLTLLEISQFDEVAVVEMGMNHSGEITKLSKIATPDIVVCTMVGRAHIGNFDGDVAKLALAKQEIYDANPNAKMIFNYDNQHTLKMFQKYVTKFKTMGRKELPMAFSAFSAGADVSFRADSMGLAGLLLKGHIGGIPGEAKLDLFGRHNVANLMAAATVAWSLKMEPEQIWAALPNCKSEWGRNQLVKTPVGAILLFDGYNANPDSMVAAIKNVYETPLPSDENPAVVTTGARLPQKVAVFAEMLELGDDAEKYHADLGEMVGNCDFDTIFFYGPSYLAFKKGLGKTAFNKKLVVNAEYAEADFVGHPLVAGDLVLIKGSRGMKTERAARVWCPSFGNK